MKDIGDTYIIRHSTLPEGRHNYVFGMDKAFFEHYGRGVIRGGEMQAKLSFMKTGEQYFFEISINGRIELPCDRCLDMLELPVWVERTMELLHTHEADPGEDSIAVEPEAEEVDMGHTLYELIDLSLPMRRVHPEKEDGGSGCDEEMIKLIDRHNEENDTSTQAPDPRWEKLRKLIN